MWRLRRRLAALEARVAELEDTQIVPVWPEPPPRYDHGGTPVDGQALWRSCVEDYRQHVDYDTDEFGGYL